MQMIRIGLGTRAYHIKALTRIQKDFCLPIVREMACRCVLVTTFLRLGAGGPFFQ